MRASEGEVSSFFPQNISIAVRQSFLSKKWCKWKNMSQTTISHLIKSLPSAEAIKSLYFSATTNGFLFYFACIMHMFLHVIHRWNVIQWFADEKNKTFFDKFDKNENIFIISNISILEKKQCYCSTIFSLFFAAIFHWTLVHWSKTK